MQIRFVSFLCLIVLSLSFWSCRETGLQGSSIPLKFKGVTLAEAISPYSIELSWELQPRFTAYRVYRKGISAVQKDESFAVTQINNLEPNTVYEYGVTGYEAVSGLEEGYGVYTPVRTLTNFTGIQGQSLKSNPNGSIEVSWIMNGSQVNYEVFARRETAEWNFNQPVFTGVGVNRAVIGNLPSGGRYCFWVQAKYRDNTVEPSNQDLNFINANAPCALVQTLIPNLPQVFVSKTFIGQFPWFWTEAGDPSYQTEIFKRPLDIRIAVVNGNNYFRSLLPLSAGNQDLYAKVTNPQTGAVSLVDLTVVGLNVTDESMLFIKAIGTSTNLEPVFPRVINGGFGEQELGEQLATGDFNCDGYPDLAVSASVATPTITSGRSEATGAVAIYYGYLPEAVPGQPAPRPRLNTSGSPKADNFAPQPHLIYYTDLASQTRLGAKLVVANINRDCFARYSVSGDPLSNSHGDCETLLTSNNIFSVLIPSQQEKIKRVFSCDDLVIKTNTRAIFVSYGDPLRGLVSGSGGSSYGIDEYTCDVSSNRCRPVTLNMQSTQSVQDITAGDYNNDGYDDIAVSTIAAGALPSARLIKILKGTALGLVPDSALSTEKHIAVNIRDLNQFPQAGSLTDQDLQNNQYGFSLGTAYNSRFCQRENPNALRFRSLSAEDQRKHGLDLTKCDDLVIGAPLRGNDERGSIFYCKAGMGSPHQTNGNITEWACEEHYPDTQSLALGSVDLVKHYGATILGVPNFNGYPLLDIQPASMKPNVAGALFVSAPSSTVVSNQNAGLVFGYYMTPELVDSNQGFSSVFSPVDPLDPKHEIHVSNQVACNVTNNNRLVGAKGACHNQVIFPSPSVAGNQFGKSLALVKDVENLSRGVHSLAVSAPYRTITSQDGSRSILQHGAVYLFKGDISQFGFDNSIRVTSPRVRSSTSPSCTADCTRYSGGVNPAGPSLIYPFNLTEASLFGLGNMAGDDFDGDNAADIAIGAPRYSLPTFYNGGAWIFTSNGNFGSTVNIPFALINSNISKEINYKFERAKIVGDVNGDGYDDVVTHIARPNRVELIVFYGSSQGIKILPAPTRIPVAPLDPLLVVVDDDIKFGKEFYRIGSVNGDAYDDLLVLGDKGSYIYHGSSSGLVTALQPSFTPNGQSSLKFATGLGSNSLNLHNSKTFGHANPSDLSVDGTSLINRHVVYGDYNGDGYSDFAISTASQEVVTVTTANGINYAANNQGRVWVFYGGSQGIQINRTLGRTLFSSNSEVEGHQPCRVLGVCKVQVLANPQPSNAGLFGYQLATIRANNSNFNDGKDSLVIAAPGASVNEGAIFVFKGSDRGLLSGTISTVVSRVRPHQAGSNQYFGSTLAEGGDINGDGFNDLMVVAAKGNSSKPLIYILFGIDVLQAGAPFFEGITASTHLIGTQLGVNRFYSSTAFVQRIQWDDGLLGVYKNFGLFVSSAGDLNQDGYQDIIISAPLADYNQDVTIPGVGAYIIFFGTNKGLSIGSTTSTADGVPGVLFPPTSTPQCYQGSTPRCEPSLIYLPNSNDNETSYLSDSCMGDLNGDGIPDLLMGSPGRHHPSSQAYGTGVFYAY